jgi:tetratricopeptide (TPR) repeat protein
MVPPVLAFSLFIVYFLQIRSEPFARHLVANPLVYDMEARQILSGEPYGRAFFMSPLYPGFVALVYKLARPDHLLVPYAQGILLAINVLILALVSRKLLGDVAALIASFAMAFYWSFYYFAGEMVPATLSVTFVLLAALLFLYRDGKARFAAILGGALLAAVLFIMRGLPGLQNPGGGEAHLAALLLAVIFLAGAIVLIAATLASGRLRAYANIAGSGLLLGVGCLVWGAVVVLALPMVLVLLLGKTRRLAGTGVFLLALCIPFAASYMHNRVASGDRVLATTSFGVNLFIGNNPASDGMDPFRLGENDSVRQEADRLRLTGAPRSDFFAARAYDYMRTDTAGWLSLLRKKALLSLSRHEIDNNADISERRSAWRRGFLARLHFGIVFPLALVGIAAAFLKRDDRTLPAWGFLAFTGVCLVFFVCERFRLPGIVFLLPLAVAGATLLGRGLAGRSRGVAIAVLLVIVGAAVSNIDFLTLADYEFPSIIVNKAYVERLDGNHDRARQLAHLAISREPGNAGAHYQLGAIEETQGDGVAAISYYLEALQRDPYYAASYRGAQRVLEGAGVSPSYLDRYLEMAMRGEDLEEEKQRIIGFVDGRAP